MSTSILVVSVNDFPPVLTSHVVTYFPIYFTRYGYVPNNESVIFAYFATVYDVMVVWDVCTTIRVLRSVLSVYHMYILS